MSSQSEKPFGQRTAIVSLVAALSCAGAGNALASLPTAPANTGAADLSARVAALGKRIEAINPALARRLPQLTNVAQWRNR
jgi:hypothetical protein